jgi:hypothetical protein
MSDFSEWLKQQIKEAQSIERLEFLGRWIAESIAGGLVIEGIKDIRQAWARKKKELDERSN